MKKFDRVFLTFEIRIHSFLSPRKRTSQTGNFGSCALLNFSNEEERGNVFPPPVTHSLILGNWGKIARSTLKLKFNHSFVRHIRHRSHFFCSIIQPSMAEKKSSSSSRWHICAHIKKSSPIFSITIAIARPFIHSSILAFAFVFSRLRIISWGEMLFRAQQDTSFLMTCVPRAWKTSSEEKVALRCVYPDMRINECILFSLLSGMSPHSVCI